VVSSAQLLLRRQRGGSTEGSGCAWLQRRCGAISSGPPVRSLLFRATRRQGGTAWCGWPNDSRLGPHKLVWWAGNVTEPLKLISYYCLNHSSWPLSNNREVTCRLCRVKPGKSLTSQDRQLYIKLTRRRVQR
jgi:hypothetical protein